jgi:cobalt-precorrin 5A hydrolase
VVGGQAVIAAVAIGVGCRRGCPANAIETLVRKALELAPAAERLGIFTIRDKSGEAGLIEAARRLELDLVFLTRGALQGQELFVRTPSVRAQALFGVASVAEAAALAGAGAGSMLIVPRMTGQDATCAVAGSWVNPA